MANELSGIVYVNGEFCEANEAKISVFDRGFIFGDGIYEAIPVVNQKLVDRVEFWERFESSLSKIELKRPTQSREEFEDILNQIIKRNSLIEGSVYIEVTRGAAPRDFEFLKDPKQTVVVFCYEKCIFDNPLAKSGIEVVSVEDIRWKRCDIKSVSLLAQCIAKTQAHRAGAFEGFMIKDGYVTEASSSSAFIIKNNTLITKALSSEILPGIRRQGILKFADEINLKVELRNFTMQEVYESDECFISAASLIILPVIKADNRLINGGKIGEWTLKLRQMYADKMKKEALA